MPGNGAIRVLVVDGHPIFRMGIRTLLSGEPEIDLVGEADDGESALRLVQQLRPDIVLLDLELPGANGLDVLKRLVGLRVATRTVLLASTIDRSQVRAALVRGAWGVLLKHTATDLLTKCIHRVHSGEYWLERETVGDLVEALRNPGRVNDPAGPLTTREREIVALVVTGASNKDIAGQLGLNEQTVKNHLRKVFEKLQVTNRVELALTAVERRLVTPADAASPAPPDDNGGGSPRRRP